MAAGITGSKLNDKITFKRELRSSNHLRRELRQPSGSCQNEKTKQAA